MKYLKHFETEAAYTAYKNSEDYILPNVSFVEELAHLPAGDPRKSVMFNPYVEPQLANVGDIAYWDGSSVKTISSEKYTSSLGNAIGVVVVPEGFAPDGKTRIISLTPIDKNGDATDVHMDMTWGNSSSYSNTNTSLTDYYGGIPITNNTSEVSSSTNSYGYLPSDSFSGTQSFVDELSNYKASSKYIPSPYINGSTNTDYFKTIRNGNPLSDFSGINSTQILVKLGSLYTAANACWKYKDGLTDIQWYLPAIGELGYLIPRFDKINESITSVGGIAIAKDKYLWAATEYGSYQSYCLYTGDGYISANMKSDTKTVRPFAIID